MTTTTLATECFECEAPFSDVSDMHQKKTHTTAKGYFWVMVCSRCYARSAVE